MRVRAVLVLAVAAITSCYKPPANECAYRCTAASGCPAGLVCSDGFCLEPGSTAVCGGESVDAAEPDTSGDGSDPDGSMTARRYVKLAVGAHHGCAIDTAGDLWCWGLNDSRQLGVPMMTDNYAGRPQRVPHPMTGGTWTDIAAGAYHTCGLWTPSAADAQLYCWGQNFSYQTGTSTGSTTTVQQVAAPASSRWKSLALGSAHSCAIVDDTARQVDEIYCWGDNSEDQLATPGGPAQRAMPVAIDDAMVSPATVRWRSLTSGTDHSCAVAMDGKAYCWGDNSAGQGGRTGGGTASQALAVSGGLSWDKVAAGDDFTCGIDTATRTLRCWGRNGSRELGNGGTTPATAPTGVIDQGATARWKDLSLGLYSACGIQGPTASTDAIGTVRCWGDNDFGQRGDGTFVTPTSGPTFGVIDAAFAVDSGHEFACALVGDPATGGDLYCWGDNADGQIGTGFASDQRRPVRIGEGVRGSQTWLSVAAGRRHTCAILSGATVADRRLYCWGAGMSGQLDATPHPVPQRSPVLVAQGNGATDVVVGSSHTCVRREVLGETEVTCWGSDQGKQLGVSGNQEPGPVITFGSGHAGVVNAIVGAGNVTCAIGSPAARCWGTPELTTASYVDQDVPTIISFASETPNGSLSVGPSSACWIDGNDTHCFGSNSYGQLGHGAAGDPPSQPATAFMLTGATALSVGPSNHKCAITTDRVTVCWGANGYGQAGANDGNDRFAPNTVQAPNQFDAIATGLNHTCGRDGTSILCWGNNDQFQRSAIPSASALPPAPIVAPVGETMPAWSSVVTGEYHTCAISSAGVLYCWGASRWGQVGAGAASEASAVRVMD